MQYIILPLISFYYNIVISSITCILTKLFHVKVRAFQTWNKQKENRMFLMIPLFLEDVLQQDITTRSSSKIMWKKKVKFGKWIFRCWREICKWCLDVGALENGEYLREKNFPLFVFNFSNVFKLSFCNDVMVKRGWT